MDLVFYAMGCFFLLFSTGDHNSVTLIQSVKDIYSS